MARVKVCGITNIEDAKKAIYYGAWAIGFIFHKDSPRYVSPSKVRKIIEELPPFVTPVGVFVNNNERAVRDICSFTRIRTVQFHGDESTVYCKRFKDYKIIKAFRVKEFLPLDIINQYKVDAYLFDTLSQDSFGGTGAVFNWDILKGQNFRKPIIISGGLNVQNAKAAIQSVNPYAIDVSSGVEKMPGIKDHRLIKEFFDSIALP